MKRGFKFVAFLCLILLLVKAPSLWAEWVVGGMPVCTAFGETPGGEFKHPQITTDGSGGAIITWEDYRDSSVQRIYSQRIDAGGNIHWLIDGVAICPGTLSSQRDCQITHNGAGGAIITWGDDRGFISGMMGADIYAQRIDAGGNIQWPTDGVAICTAWFHQSYPQITSDGSGGAIITWHDTRGYYMQIYVQRIDAGGNIQWPPDGVAICAELPGYRSDPQITPDGAGGAIITWQDKRSGDYDIYAQRINASGTIQWTANGEAICTNTAYQETPQIISTDSGGAIITWQDYRSDMLWGPDSADVYAQLIDANGTIQWAVDGEAISTGTGDQNYPQITPDGSGGATITWADNRGGDYDIYAQRIDANGTIQWTVGGEPVCSYSGDQGSPQITSGGSGEAIIIWHDGRGADTDVYAQRIGAGGNIQWPAYGVAICTAIKSQNYIRITSDGSGEAIITWRDYRFDMVYPPDSTAVYVARTDPRGLVSTLLQSFNASYTGNSIEIRWTLAELTHSMEFSILRKETNAGFFEEIPGAAINRNGLIFSFLDQGVKPGSNYSYRIMASSDEGSCILFETDVIETPKLVYTLKQNHPNPFNPTTRIRYSIPDQRQVKLEVFDVAGHQVSVLVDRVQPGGTYSVDWNGCDTKGTSVSSGIYFYRLTAGKETKSRKMVLLR